MKYHHQHAWKIRGCYAFFLWAASWLRCLTSKTRKLGERGVQRQPVAVQTLSYAEVFEWLHAVLQNNTFGCRSTSGKGSDKLYFYWPSLNDRLSTSSSISQRAFSPSSVLVFDIFWKCVATSSRVCMLRKTALTLLKAVGFVMPPLFVVPTADALLIPCALTHTNASILNTVRSCSVGHPVAKHSASSHS